MVDNSKRVHEATVQFLFEFLMSLTLIHKDFDPTDAKIPTIIIVLTNFSRID